MRAEEVKSALLLALITASLSAPLLFAFGASDSSSTPPATPAQIQLSGGSTSEPTQIKVKVSVLQGASVTMDNIRAMIREANEALKNSGIQLVLTKVNENVPGNAGNRDNRDNLRDNVRRTMENENIKGIGITIAPPGSIDNDNNINGVTVKGNPASVIVAVLNGATWAHETGHVLCLQDLYDNENNLMHGVKSERKKTGLSPEQNPLSGEIIE